MVRDFEERDEGKRVVTADGEMVGTVEQVQGSRAHVRPGENLARSVRRRLGWSEEDEETYELQKRAVDRIESDEIRLKRNPQS